MAKTTTKESSNESKALDYLTQVYEVRYRYITSDLHQAIEKLLKEAGKI